MNDLLNLYSVLLEVYTKQVRKLEEIKSENQKIRWIPSEVLNSRIFIYDEYLQNSFYGGFCYEEKNKIASHLVRFITVYECSTEKAIKIFEGEKEQNYYQKQLDCIIFNKIPVEIFFKAQLSELQKLEYTYERPYPPKRKNASRKLSQYKLDKTEYLKKIDSLNRCREEVNERIKFIKEIKIDFVTKG